MRKGGRERGGGLGREEGGASTTGMMVSRHRHLRANRREGYYWGCKAKERRRGEMEGWREGWREGACVMGGCECLNRRKLGRERNMYR